MSCTGEDGRRDVHFRLMDQLKPHWRELAITLKFPQHEIAIMEKKDNPVYYLFSEWLRGANQENDPRPMTWRTLIVALRHANIQEEATVLEKHFIEIFVTAPNTGGLIISCMCLILGSLPVQQIILCYYVYTCLICLLL